MALAQRTDIIFLDEPTTYLDICHQLEILELVQKLNQEQGLDNCHGLFMISTKRFVSQIQSLLR